ncbi:ABC transporter substrate-binding protein [Frankia sp. AgB1.9]|uniref:ABC transporter substrate-binding protein n=1 Tax=unclassified Frankia TaxID=2632575 RepID=UPI0019318D7F|nr:MULTISPECIES: ABC transporter substrate-binding protein [unclassified Frankia]MBL7489459.1 ABC transporter substrate-binding protein [Frankia sp. AgW1.1]MBL7552842.1 ABC transporter substrate-binding protein [Frankia sp. AgB1.9]MBL7624397.1 ABC transporter substrate-binding protein [Frankia sp. AgB1.8]
MKRKSKITVAAGLCAATVFLAAGCGSSSGSGAAGASGTTQPGKTKITVGVITDITGPAAASNKSVVDGVKAGTYYASRNGYTIKYIVGDTATSPATALAVAQRMVTQDHVFAVLANSSLMFAAAPYLTQHNVPVIGAAEDGPEWIAAKNMFSIWGPLQTTKVSSTYGKFLKMMGVTNLGVLAVDVPSASESGQANAVSAQEAGIKVGYLNAKFPLGGDVGPAVLAMKAAGIDGFVSASSQDTSFAVIKGLRDQGVNLKVAFLPTGYGGDLFSAGPGAAQNAQGVYFLSSYELVEMHTPATKQFVADLAQAGITSEPTYASYNGYVTVGLLVRALEAAGANPTEAGLIKALEGIHDFDALGLYGTHTVDINDRENIVFGADNCLWVAQFEGNGFKPVPNAAPICGELIPGKTVSPAS